MAKGDNMNQIFINTKEEMKPGEIHNGSILNKDGEHMIAVRCIRSASKEEYLKFVYDQNLTHMVKRNIHERLDLNFYLVEVLD